MVPRHRFACFVAASNLMTDDRNVCSASSLKICGVNQAPP